MPSHVPHKSNSEIEAYAETILAEHQPEDGIPVQVEEIIEFGFGMEIRPIRALNSRFGFEGALSHDLQTIFVDEEFMQRYPNRYRFTLAHELGHRVIHGEFIRSLVFTDKEAWKSSVMGIDPTTYGIVERQAYIFAGYLLVPSPSLRLSCREASELAWTHGIELGEMGETAMSYVAGRLAKQYRVSTAVIERRLRAENLP